MTRSGDHLRSARLASGLSVRRLAQLAGVSPSTIWRIEAGRLDPTVGMFDRLLSAAGGRSSSAAMTREEAVSLALGRLTAAAVLRDPSLIGRARGRVARVLKKGELTASAWAWAEEWRRLLAGSFEDVIAALIDPSGRGYELRSHTPFTGVISEEERLDAVRQASKEHRAARPA